MPFRNGVLEWLGKLLFSRKPLFSKTEVAQNILLRNGLEACEYVADFYVQDNVDLAWAINHMTDRGFLVLDRESGRLVGAWRSCARSDKPTLRVVK